MLCNASNRYDFVTRVFLLPYSARQPRDTNVPNGSCIVLRMSANGTRDATSQLSLLVSSRRLGHGKSSGGYDSSMQHATPQQMWRTVTAIYTRLTAETWWQQLWRTVTANIISLISQLDQDPRYPRGKSSQSQSARCYLSRSWAHRAVDRGNLARC